jgi:hypothetical protein
MALGHAYSESIATKDPDDSVERLDHFGNAFVVLYTNPNIIRVVDNAI